MELLTVSFPHVYHRLSRNETHQDLFRESSFGSTKRKLRRQSVVSVGQVSQGYGALFPARGGNCCGCGFCSHCRDLRFLDSGLDGKRLHRGRRRKAAGYWKRREWGSVSVESGANGSSENSPGSVHFVGIGGSGLSALALLALRQGWQVSGSDLLWSEQIERLKEAGARVYVGHHAAQMIPQGALPPDALVVSSAVGPGNEEVDAAFALNVPIYKRDTWLGKVTEGYELIAIAGTHGKSTTTAMLSVVLHNLGEDITAIVGAQVPQCLFFEELELDKTFMAKAPMLAHDYMGFRMEAMQCMGLVANLFYRCAPIVSKPQADEYDGCFLDVSPSLAVVTNVEWEHVDMFPNEEAVRDIFKRFMMRIKPGGYLVICDDSGGAKSLLGLMKEEEDLGSQSPEKRRVVTYGVGGSSDWRAIMLVPNPQGGTDYTVVYKNRPMTRVSLRLPGMYNVLNSLAVIVVMSLLAAEKESDGENQARAMKRVAEDASNALGFFSGVRRRFDWIGTVQGCHIIDDYAHHPTEVRAVLQAARQLFDQQPIWVIFQPHTVSRLATFLPDFAPAFSAADRVIVTEVYSARNIQTEKTATGEDLANAIIGPPAVYIPDSSEVVERLSWELAAIDKNAMNDRGNIVLLTLGAGDITNVGPQLMQALSVPTS